MHEESRQPERKREYDILRLKRIQVTLRRKEIVHVGKAPKLHRNITEPQILAALVHKSGSLHSKLLENPDVVANAITLDEDMPEGESTKVLLVAEPSSSRADGSISIEEAWANLEKIRGNRGSE